VHLDSPSKLSLDIESVDSLLLEISSQRHRGHEGF